MSKSIKSLLVAVGIIAAVLLAPKSHADPNQADLSRPFGQYADKFVGNWRAHGEAVTINISGA
jgi:hypothetical protein